MDQQRFLDKAAKVSSGEVSTFRAYSDVSLGVPVKNMWDFDFTKRFEVPILKALKP